MSEVTIEQGSLLGGKSCTDEGFEYYEFLQIPYAKPPVGGLRFQSPQSPEPWTGLRDATFADKNGISIQLDMLNRKLCGSEDCLYLNVFTPQLPSPGSAPLPVMVYIHGGGFISGNGTLKDKSGPDYLIQHNVLVVTINYRLGALGFLFLDIPEAAGNMGLKDQVAALLWIQKNIASFGGNKDNVTIFGVSAGGASVEYLCLSQKTKGLFHKAISQSGSALNHWSLSLNIKELSLQLASALGCEATDEKDILDFLLRAPADAIGAIAYETIGFATINKTYFGFSPTIEVDFGNGDAIITDYPYNIMKSKGFHDIPVMAGFCEFEGLLASMLYEKHVREKFEQKNFTHFFTHPLEASEALNSKIKKVYMDEYVRVEEDLPEQPMVNFIGDLDFGSGINLSAQVKSCSDNPVYLYLFAYNDHVLFEELMAKMRKDENSPKIIDKPKKRGASHAEDAVYIIKGLVGLKLSDTGIVVMKRLSKMWTDFAKTGNPTPTTSELIPVKWPVFNAHQQQYLKIGTKLEITSKYFPNKLAIFEDLYEKNRR